jgi:hypothetical protein
MRSTDLEELEMKIMCTKFNVLLVTALMTSSAYGVPGDVWDLQGDFSELSNPSTVTQPSGDSASWLFTHERVPLLGPVVDNFPSEMPGNFGWTINGGSLAISMTLFEESSAAAGVGTNWLAGEVGGHSSTSFGVGTTWTSIDGGRFQVDFSAFLARGVPNQTQQLRLSSPNGGLETFVIDQFANISSANAVSDTRTFTLFPNESLSLEMKGSDWFGMTMHITELIQVEVDFVWNADGLGDWNSATSWLPAGGPPGSAGSPQNANHTVVFGGNITGRTNVSVNDDVTLNRIEFDNATHSYAVSGLASVNLVSSTVIPTADPTIDVTGTHQFQAIVNLFNDTTVNVSSNSTLSFNNELALNGQVLTKTGAGTMAINNALSSGGGTVNCNEGTCSGSGTIGGDLNNNGGTISPGNSPGVMAVTGDFSQSAESSLLIELGGTAAGTEHDMFRVDGEAALDGTLEVRLVDGFLPSLGDRFDILEFSSSTGQFNEILMPDLAGSLAWEASSLLLGGSISVVPEPTTCGLFWIGIVSIGLRKRWRLCVRS